MLREPIIMLVKLPTKERPKDSQDVHDEWRWDSLRSRWLQWNPESKVWVANHKPLPQWFIDAGGVISASVLFSLLKESTSFGEVHKQVFWLSKFELQELLDHLVISCKQYGVEPPSLLSLDDKIGEIPVSEWLEQGLVVPVECAEPSVPSDNSGTTYDPMQALFEAQEKRSGGGLPESRPFFQTVEQGKFTAKH